MLPLYYQNCLSSQLKKTEYLTLAIVVSLLQIHKQVSIERLATVWSYPILFESRRRNLQRFFKLPVLRIETIWFPLVKYILNTAFKNQSVLMLAIDRTQWRHNNLFFISLIWSQRAIPLYWEILPKRGSTNLQERYIQSEKEEYQRLSELGLIPGTGFYKSGVKVTKQKGFGCFDVAGYWKRKYRNNGTSEGWYLLTNVGSLKLAVASFKCRSGIEAMFKDCKTGGYNLENSHACYDRLKSLILLIAIAYTCAIIQGHTIKQMGIQKYVGRVQELGRSVRRHSSFWIGLYGECWVTGSEVCQDLVTELMRIRSNKRPFFKKGIRARALILSTL